MNYRALDAALQCRLLDYRDIIVIGRRMIDKRQLGMPFANVLRVIDLPADVDRHLPFDGADARYHFTGQEKNQSKVNEYDANALKAQLESNRVSGQQIQK